MAGGFTLLPLGLAAFVLIFLAIITITVAASIVVCWKARKAKSPTSFHIHKNKVYHGIIILQRSGAGSAKA
jgi:hypothetical protein